jgi:hypothetical protein
LGGINLIIFLLIIVAIIFLCVHSSKKEKERKSSLNVPDGTGKIRYYEGYSEKLSSHLYFWHDNNSLTFCDSNGDGRHIVISKENILNFNMIGEYHEDTKVTGGKVKGGGVSVVGAVAGGAIAGPVGMILGGRKKVKSKPIKTTTTVTDTRKIILKFKENEEEKGMILDKSVYDVLCFVCPEKKIN